MLDGRDAVSNASGGVALLRGPPGLAGGDALAGTRICPLGVEDGRVRYAFMAQTRYTKHASADRTGTAGFSADPDDNEVASAACGGGQ